MAAAVRKVGGQASTVTEHQVNINKDILAHFVSLLTRSEDIFGHLHGQQLHAPQKLKSTRAAQGDPTAGTQPDAVCYSIYTWPIHL